LSADLGGDINTDDRLGFKIFRESVNTVFAAVS
jgi:hypothetical protein